MTYKDYIPSEEYKKFEQLHGEDTFIKLNLLYIAFELNELCDECGGDSAFDELCEDVLEIALDEAFERYNVIDVADAVEFIIHDSNYTVGSYESAYQRNKERVCEELLAYLDKKSRVPEEKYEE